MPESVRTWETEVVWEPVEDWLGVGDPVDDRVWLDDCEGVIDSEPVPVPLKVDACDCDVVCDDVDVHDDVDVCDTVDVWLDI